MRTVRNRHRSLSVKGKRLVSVALAVLIALSMLLVAVPLVAAKNDFQTFENMETVYIDTSGLPGFSDSNAGVNIWTYYPDNVEWNRQNNKSDTDCMNDVNSASQGKNLVKLDAVQLTDTLWKVDIPGDNKIPGGDNRDYGDKALRVLRVNFGSNGGQIWNYTDKIFAGEGRVNGGKPDMIKLTGWNGAKMNYEWGYSIPTSGGTSNTYSSTASDDIISSSTGDNPTIYPITAKFYDYYTDDEVKYGWRNIKQDTTRKDWEPYQYFNKLLGQQANSDNVATPLYFGNFYDKDDGYLGVGGSSLSKFKNLPNNSNRLATYSTAYTGLTEYELVNGKLAYKGGAISPLFNDDWLTSKGVATIVSTEAFPMRIDRSTGVTYYEYDSKNAKDVAYFTGSGNNMKINYGTGAAYGIKDAESKYGGDSDGYGFLPFDEHGTEGKDFGFGMRADIQFNVANNGYLYRENDTTHSNPVEQVFRFSGDDDVWVFIDNKLVLDMGGDHKVAQGEINFHTLTATVSTGTTGSSSGGNTDFSSWFKNDEPNTKHTLTMFYIERGLSESNLRFGFNFSPLSNEFITDKTVELGDLNSGLSSAKDALKSADTFGFTHKENNTPSANKEYSNSKTGNKTTDSNGKYTLKNSESADFLNQFTVGSNFKVKETNETGIFSYSTRYTVKDLIYEEKGGDPIVAQGTGTDSEFTFKTKDDSSPLNATKLQLSYVNTMKTGEVSISKTVVDEQGQEIVDNTVEFNAVVSLSFDKGQTYSTYPLVYDIYDSAATGKVTKTMGSDGKIVVKEGRTIKIGKLPAGTYVKVDESTQQGYVPQFPVSGNAIVVDEDDSSMEIMNQRPMMKVDGEIGGEKALDDEDYSGRLFTFRIRGLNAQISDKDVDTSSVDVEVSSVSDGDFSKQFSFTKAGIYRYMITEKAFDAPSGLVDDDIYSVSKAFLAAVTITDNGNTLKLGGIDYYNYDYEARQGRVEASDFASGKKVQKMQFNNVTRSASLTIDKSNQVNDKINGTEFSVYKIDTDLSPEELKNTMTYDDVIALQPFRTQVTNDNGIAKFENLKIYKDGYTDTSSSLPKYQVYAVIETSPRFDYHLNRNVEFFSFPTYDQSEQVFKYDYTFEYVNGKIRNPMTSGGGMRVFRTVGLIVIAFVVLLLTAYVLYIKKTQKKAVHFSSRYKHLRK